MRIDLTVSDGVGPDRDIAVELAGPTRLEQLVQADDVLRRAVEDGRPLWSGRRRLEPTDPVPGPGLRAGAVISIGRPGRGQTVDGVSRTLDVVCGPDAGRSMPLERGLACVGRAPECTLPLTDATVSRHHVEVAVTSTGVTVRDLGSTHGSDLDGAPLGCDGVPWTGNGLLRLGETLVALTDPADGTLTPDPDQPGRRPVSLSERADGLLQVHRPPRGRPDAPPAVVELPERGRSAGPAPVAWVAALIPAAVGAALAATLHSAQFLALALLSPLVVLGTALADRVQWRRRRRRSATSFRHREAAARAAVAEGLRAETGTRRAELPDPVTLARIAGVPTTRLWEREPDAPPVVRLGLGTSPSRLQVRRGGATTPAGEVDTVPLAVDLDRGPLAVVAPRGPALATARWLVAQLAVHHSPDDLEVVLVLSPHSAPAWAWTRWLPHVAAVAVGPEAHRSAFDDVRARLEDGTRRCLVVVDLPDAAGPVPRLPPTSPGRAPAVLVVDSDARRVPSWCTQLARCSAETATGVELVAPDGTVLGRARADRVSATWADSVARALAPLVDAGAGARRPTPAQCRLLDVLQMPRPTPEQVLARWDTHDGGAATPIGLTADGPLALDLVRDGPHALVAGTTGSGKSELLQSLVVGLACGHPPDELTFVLVDYKGGAAFGAAARLPHVVGLVTDLDRRLTARALASLDAELRRRERLFAAVGATDLPGYRRATPAVPVPRLVLVVDEFAALAEELPDFVAGLVGLAQRGRSLGLHLVLATQRPSGVVSPEIRANTSLRIALRVADPADSLDVVATDAAAAIARNLPGRAVVRSADGLSLLQTGYLGDAVRPERAAALVVHPLDPWRRVRPGPQARTSSATDLDVLVAAVRTAGERSGRLAGAAPWPAPLPTALPAAALGVPPAPTLVRLGRLDLPDDQTQPPLEIDLLAGGSLLVAGGPRSGRTTAALTLAGLATAQLRPDELHLHVVDDSGGLQALTRLPHTLTALRRAHAELLERLLIRLESEAQRRRARLAALGHGTLDEWLRAARDTGAAPPDPDDAACILVVIDGWDAMCAAADDGTGRVTERLQALLAACESVGITVALTGDRSCARARWSATVSTRLLLRLPDPADYLTAGIPPGAVPEAAPAGRALRAPDATEVQIAHLGSEPERSHATALLADRATATGPAPRRGPAAVRVRPLPAAVTVGELRPAAAGAHSPGRGVVLGAGGDDAAPVVLDLIGARARLLVAGPPRSGRSTALLTVLRQATADVDRVVVIAPDRSPVRSGAGTLGVPCLGPDTPEPPLLDDVDLLLVDDVDSLAGSAVGAALDEALSPGRLRGPRAVVLAGRTDALASTFRGAAAEVRRSRQALLLQPGPGDGDLVGLRLPQGRSVPVPGRGLLAGRPDWGPAFATGPLPVQVALP